MTAFKDPLCPSENGPEWIEKKHADARGCNMKWCSREMDMAYQVGEQNANGKERLQYQPNTADSLIAGLNDFPAWIYKKFFPTPEMTRTVLTWSFLFISCAILAWLGLVHTGQSNSRIVSLFG